MLQLTPTPSFIVIVFVEGELLAKQSDSVVVLCSQLGYEIKSTPRLLHSLPSVGERVRLHTHLLVREDEHSLYGFRSAQERELFLLLMRVSGIGPKLALAMIGAQEPDALVLAIKTQDARALSALPGIGKKTAERLILELADRLQHWSYSGESEAPAPAKANPARQDAELALLGLGYSQKEINNLFKNTASVEKLSTEELVRVALQSSPR